MSHYDLSLNNIRNDYLVSRTLGIKCHLYDTIVSSVYGESTNCHYLHLNNKQSRTQRICFYTKLLLAMTIAYNQQFVLINEIPTTKKMVAQTNKSQLYLQN